MAAQVDVYLIIHVLGTWRRDLGRESVIRKVTCGTRHQEQEKKEKGRDRQGQGGRECYERRKKERKGKEKQELDSRLIMRFVVACLVWKEIVRAMTVLGMKVKRKERPRRE